MSKFWDYKSKSEIKMQYFEIFESELYDKDQNFDLLISSVSLFIAKFWLKIGKNIFKKPIFHFLHYRNCSLLVFLQDL